MVRNLAREGEAYLRARGHQITAGRLYLCHFLGMEGAHHGVVGAEFGACSSSAWDVRHPGKSVSHRQECRLCGGLGREEDARPWPLERAASPVDHAEIRQTSPEFEKYKRAIAGIVGFLQSML